jgi:hypothetical protein
MKGDLKNEVKLQMLDRSFLSCIFLFRLSKNINMNPKGFKEKVHVRMMASTGHSQRYP